MDENNRKISQLETLVRLKELKKNKLTVRLKDANKQLRLAQDKRSVAESRYQLILEVQRSMRQIGRSINPLYYSHQFEAADTAKNLMDAATLNWQKMKKSKSTILADLTQEYRHLSVTRNAFTQATDTYIRELEKKEMEQCHEQHTQKSSVVIER